MKILSNREPVSYPISYPAISLNVPANGLLELEDAVDNSILPSSLIVLSFSGSPLESRMSSQLKQ